MTKKEIEQWLNENCTVLSPNGCAPDTGIRNIYDKIFNNGKNSQTPKPTCASILAEWYSDKQNIIDVWNELDNIEKEFISVFVQYRCKEHIPTTKTIAEKHKLKPPQKKQSYYSSYDFYSSSGYHTLHLLFLQLIKSKFFDTRATYLFPGGKIMPPFIYSVLSEIIPPMTFEYPEFTPAKTDYLICREHRITDISAIVHFVGSEQLKVKKGTFDITKAKLAKMVEDTGIEDVCDNDGKFSTPKNVQSIFDFKISLPLFLLAANSGLIEVGSDSFIKPSIKAVDFLSKPMHEIARELFKEYLESNKIYETHYIPHIMMRDSEVFVPWAQVRLPIFKLLKTCPVGQFVNYDDFEKYILIFCGDFLANQINSDVYVRSFNSNYYGSYAPEWSECEAKIILLILSFCNALGMLDIVYKEKVESFKFAKNSYRIGISGFRITSLGAWILGMTKKYDASETAVHSTEGELIVQPDHTVIISGLKKRVEHESYLARFLTKVSLDENVAIYKIDFTSIIKAFDQKITPLQIKKYLKKSCDKPIPENVIRSFDDWQLKVDRIKIRSVIVLETDDDLLLQELIHIKGMDKLSGDVLKHAVVIDESSTKKVKTLVEKNGWIVKL